MKKFRKMVYELGYWFNGKILPCQECLEAAKAYDLVEQVYGERVASNILQRGQYDRYMDDNDLWY